MERLFEGKEQIESALRRLNEKMVYAQLTPLALVSCGGAALNVMGLIARSTTDVDIVAIADIRPSGKVSIHLDVSLPRGFKVLVDEVGAELSLEKNWLNFGPSSLLSMGLPKGLMERAVKKRYGECLIVFFISRFDQIHLKIYAAMDVKAGERHLSDLLDLGPTIDETSAAAKWLLKRKTSASFKRKLKQVLERIGYEDLA